ncbi:hypothetical protein ASPZODRAFT_156894 [Penicilliopsis zonata CBS 506.65]|uniref:Uncharacterized protein n=1 Tax=Penicilliopsis zonata CBS 506.65 TaxID=1073090 RepID=A0A1L9SS12_9EURO|nr:hypothetical protein ASPZODRAFT_156894 [Penicilliopsis zonata CBS 506.65]OJJ49861.1 hypothetical protein ASPZODRAFT_156894 [Penicilliopsis zonata CBS 506.65]
MTPSTPVRAQTPTYSTTTYSNPAPSLPPITTMDYAPSLPQQPLRCASPGSSAFDTTTSAKRLYYETEHTLSKRTHEDSFGPESQRSLQNGARPDSDSYPSREMLEAIRLAARRDPKADMEYKRANGRTAMRAPPTLEEANKARARAR